MPRQKRACLLAVAALAAVSACSANTTASSAQATRKATYFIEFVARPNEIVVGHSFVRIGTISPRGDQSTDTTIGLFPANYPRMDAASLINARGRLATVPADRESPSARYRLMVSADTHAKALRHAAQMRRTWQRYDLATVNCNTVLFEFADRLGLDIRRDTLDLPVNVVHGLKHLNAGRTRASWRPQ